MAADANLALLTFLRETTLDRARWPEQQRADFDAFLARIRHDLDNNLEELRSLLFPDASDAPTEDSPANNPSSTEGAAPPGMAREDTPVNDQDVGATTPGTPHPDGEGRAEAR
jgi:hypothetical protein